MVAETTEIDVIPQHGREPARCELRCQECGDGMMFDQQQCATCGHVSPRFQRFNYSSGLSSSLLPLNAHCANPPASVASAVKSGINP